MKDYSELKALAEKATPGKRQWSAIKGHAFDQVYIEGSEPFCDVHAGNPYDAAFIVAACNEILSLIAENEALREALKPFAKAGGLFTDRIEPDWDIVVYRPVAGKEYDIRGHDLRRARIAYEGK